jgi:hypothetical protein
MSSGSQSPTDHELAPRYPARGLGRVEQRYMYRVPRNSSPFLIDTLSTVNPVHRPVIAPVWNLQ